jgi:hypothetical protein
MQTRSWYQPGIAPSIPCAARSLLLDANVMARRSSLSSGSFAFRSQTRGASAVREMLG